ncbi:hypothetical protein C0V70_13535 [Bacteriovorax stolpii]|uniref:DUF1554 domain-containing protein n=2 Tax=Bacteriovorax stolpii TaxID=960 RepID=A0A2K9NXK5_BACTC|nr:hypothetical protein C0V70_13535 [Bacteriovorax stolpii]
MLVVLNLLVLASCIQSKGNAPSLSSDDSSGGGGGTTTPAECGEGGDCRMFVTSATIINGNQGASAAAAITTLDSLCNSDSNKPSTGTYKALVASDARNPSTDWVLYPNQAYVRKNGTTPIGTTTGASVFNGTLTNAVVDIAGNYINWMTGIDIDASGNWSGSNTNNTCINFTSSSVTKYFAYGRPTTSADDHFGYNPQTLQNVHCNLSDQGDVSDEDPHILCVEQ